MSFPPRTSCSTIPPSGLSLQIKSLLSTIKIIQCLRLSSACFLHLNPFLDSVEPDLIQSDDVSRRGTASDFQSGGASTRPNLSSVNSAGRSKVDDGTRMKPLSKPYHAADIEGGHEANRDDSNSQNSRTQPIEETRTSYRVSPSQIFTIHLTIPLRWYPKHGALV